MRNNIIFRKANIDDLDAIESIYERSHDAEEAGFTTTGWLRGIYPVRRVAEESLARGDMYVAELADNRAEEDAGFEYSGTDAYAGFEYSGTDAYAGFEDGESKVSDSHRIVATGVINQIQVDVYALCDWVYKGPDDDVSVLHTLAVDPEARGMGIGPAFVEFWEKLAAEEGCSILRIDTNAINKRARAMYAKLGYIESGIVPTVFNGIPGVDLVLMEKFNGTEIQRRLREMQDVRYADFQVALIPGKEREQFIGVRTPQLRAYAKELLKAARDEAKTAKEEDKVAEDENKAAKEEDKVAEDENKAAREVDKGAEDKSKATGSGGAVASAAGTGLERGTDLSPESTALSAFFNTLPHRYFDEMQLHAFLISEIKDFDSCVEAVEAFLPYVDNWATCDQLSPKVFAKKKNGRLVHGADLLECINRWLESDETYTVRFGIGMLLAHYLDADFDPAYMDRVAEIRSEEYYINMMIAWYFATALAKQYDAALPVLLQNRLNVWTHNKTIQKAVESRRITDDQKTYLKTLKKKTEK